VPNKKTPQPQPPSVEELTQLIVDLEREIIKKVKRDVEVILSRDIELTGIESHGHSKSDVFILFENMTNCHQDSIFQDPLNASVYAHLIRTLATEIRRL
jgi:hypothetical protein